MTGILCTQLEAAEILSVCESVFFKLGIDKKM